MYSTNYAFIYFHSESLCKTMLWLTSINQNVGIIENLSTAFYFIWLSNKPILCDFYDIYGPICWSVRKFTIGESMEPPANWGVVTVVIDLWLNHTRFLQFGGPQIYFVVPVEYFAKKGEISPGGAINMDREATNTSFNKMWGKVQNENWN